MTSSGLKHSAWVVPFGLAIILIVSSGGTAVAQDAVGGKGVMNLPIDQVPAELQKNFLEMVHYYRIARPDLAADFAGLVLAANPDPAVLLAMVEGKADGKPVGINLLDQMILSGTPELSDVAKKMLSVTLLGVEAKKKDGQRIQTQLIRLGKNIRGYELGLRELKYSGQYVVPYALGILADESKTALHDPIKRALLEINRPVLYPLILGLNTDTESVRLVVIELLGNLGYRMALPALKVLVEEGGTSDAVKQAASGAIVKIAGQQALGMSARQLHFDLAQLLYYDQEFKSFRVDPRRPSTDVWSWVPGSGVEYRPAPTQAVNEIMAAHAAEAGLKVAPKSPELVALWLSIRAQMKDELSDAGGKNPWDPANIPTTEFFLRAAGQQYLFDVLDRALKDDRVRVARQAIWALEEVANEGYLGATALDSGSPLIRALAYPDRMVRFDAAFAIASVGPKKDFLHADRVVPVLAEAVNLESGQGVLIIDANQNNVNRLKGEFRKAGWNVADATNGNEGISAGRGMARLDGVLLSANVENVNYVEVVQQLRNRFATAMVPIIILSAEAEPVMFSQLKANTKYIAQAPAAATMVQLAQRIQVLQEEAGSVALAAKASKSISLRAAQALRYVATADLAFGAKPARGALMAAAAGENEDLAVAAMAALVQMPDQEIQQHLAAIAMTEGASDRVQIAALHGVAQMARHIGNGLQTATVTALRTRVGNLPKAKNAVKDAIGRALGALDLDPAQASEFILEHAVK
jgi:CheY-like chemotaxis protein